MSWVAPLLDAHDEGHLSAAEVWDVVLACVNESDPTPVVAHCLIGLGLPAPERIPLADEMVVILDDGESAA